jgi:uncharacterized protein YuzE
MFGAAALARGEILAGKSTASPEANPARSSAGRMQSVVVATLDIDRNGVLSAVEIAHAPTVLRALDLNADGALSSDELRRFEAKRQAEMSAANPARPSRSGHLSAGFNVAFALDANHDGEIQAMEIANATLSLKTLDANGDGQLTSNELRPSMVVAQNFR